MMVRALASGCTSFALVPALLLTWLRGNLRAAEDTFLREWALLAVRNLCELSSEAQDAIKCVRVLQHLHAFVLTG
jgi:hypothetical protein